MYNPEKSKLDFSIVIPTYNRAHLMLKTIDSALNQRYQSFEVILVDDGSTDNTEEVARSINNPRLIYFKKENGERGAARNLGVAKSNARYITFCDSDDLLYPDYLSNAAELISKYDNIPWFHLNYEIRRQNKKPIKMTLLSSNFLIFLAKGNPLSCMGVFVRKEILDIHRFNENRYLSGSEDWELWLRLAANYPIVFDNRVSAALLAHDERSVLQVNELKLSLRKFLSIGYAFDDEAVQSVFGRYKNMMEAYFDTYIALHLLLGAENKKALRYLWSAVSVYPLSLFERRGLAIVKHLMLNLVYNKKNKA